jgi:peptide deformylase
MAIRPITLFGDSILKKKAKHITKITKSIHHLLDDMFDTMYNAEGMGLAANQIGREESIFIVDISSVKGFEGYKPMIFINPKIIEYSEEKSVVEEGCLSLPGIRAKIERPKAIKLLYNDIDMNEHELKDDGLIARVIQHENDHLLGIYFTERADDETQKMLKKPLAKIKNRKIDFTYPVTEKSVG